MSTLIISNNKNIAINYIVKTIETKEKRRVNILNNIDISYYNGVQKNLSTATIRELNNFLEQKSLELTKKYLIISNFNRASQEAQNAFLKTLEENPNEIFLISKNLNGILPTIISRVFIKKIEEGFKYNKKINELIKQIVNGDLARIKNLSKDFNLEKVLNNLEYYMYKNKNKYSKEQLINFLNKVYKCKKQSIEVKLNAEIQITNIIIELL